MRWWLLPALLCGVGFCAEGDSASTEKPDEKAIEKHCLEMLAQVWPVDSKPLHQVTSMTFPEGRAMWGLLFEKTEVTVLVSFQREPMDVFDYPPNWLSLLVWQEGRWHYRQLLGSASSFDIHRRSDLGLQIVQGYCQTERHGGEQSSWKYDEKTRRLLPTGLDDWGPYRIKGSYICYARGHERLAHWETTWVYRFENGRRGDLVGCLHQDDEGRFAVTFTKAKPTEMQTWGFRTAPKNESIVVVCEAKEPEDLYGEEIAMLVLPKNEFLSPSHCFALLTKLSAELLTDEWSVSVSKPKLTRIPIQATGAEEVVQAFQWPQPNKKKSR